MLEITFAQTVQLTSYFYYTATGHDEQKYSIVYIPLNCRDHSKITVRNFKQAVSVFQQSVLLSTYADETSFRISAVRK